MKRINLAPLFFLTCIPAVIAQQLPNSGGQMQQIPIVPSTIISPQVPIGLIPNAIPKMDATNEMSIPVKALQIKGLISFSESDLLAQTGFISGSQLTLSQLRAMTELLVIFYHRQGYFAAQVYLPPQKIQDGVVTIVILEGLYGKVILQNESRASDDSIAYFLKDISTGTAIVASPLESKLLLLSDMPGVLVHSTLVPGSTLGSSDLLVKTTAAPQVSGSIDVDNAGNRYTGTTRAGATLNINELLGYGDLTSLRVLSSGKGLQYVRGAYQAQFGKTTAGISYSDLRYVLGREFENLGAHGSQQVVSLFASYPLVRSRNQNLYAGINFDSKRFEDVVDATSNLTHKHANVISTSLRGDAIDKSGSNSFGLTWSSGQIDLKDTSLQVIDSSTANTQGHFNKLSFNATRLHKVSKTVSVYASVNGQVASKNLDVSEKMELGGMYAVRAYPEGEAFADQGYVLTVESRLQLNPITGYVPGQFQLIGFVDTGTILTNKNQWEVGTNRRTLSGAGIGLNWSQSQSYNVRAYYAFKLGNETAQSAPDKNGRFWVQGVKYF